MKKVFSVLVIFCLVGCVGQLSDSDRYLEEEQKVKRQDSGADFTKLRLYYTNTAMYKPFGGKEKELMGPMFNAMQKRDYKICLQMAGEILEVNYVSLNAHYAATRCNYGLGAVEEGVFHKYVLDGLVASVGASGTGTSKEDAYVTISPNEMKAFLDLHGLDVRRQKTDRDKRKGRAYRIITVVDETGGRKEVVFDITSQMSKGL